jgi:hypothetical protein
VQQKQTNKQEQRKTTTRKLTANAFTTKCQLCLTTNIILQLKLNNTKNAWMLLKEESLRCLTLSTTDSNDRLHYLKHVCHMTTNSRVKGIIKPVNLYEQ